MCNAASKFIVAVISVVSLASCGNSLKEQAMQLSATAEKEVKAGNYQEALVVLDSLDTHYASEVEVRRSAMKFRAMAVEGITIRRISAVDDTLSVLKRQLDEFEQQFSYVENPGKGLGGNYVAKSIIRLKSDIMPKINDDGYFTLSVIISGKSIGFKRIALYDDDEVVAADDIKPSRLVKVENSEMTVLQQEEVERVLKWLDKHPKDANYMLSGSKSSIKGKMSQTLGEAIITTWRFAQAKQAYRLALIEREKLERKLQLCRDQLANVIDR